MTTLRLCVAAATFLLLGATAQAQGSVTPRGTYTFQTDSGYAGPDLTGLTVSFDDSNQMVVSGPDGTLLVKSKLTFENGVMTLNDQDGTNVCQYAGKYRVVGDAKSFKLTLVEDGCPDRSAIVTTVKFVKQG